MTTLFIGSRCHDKRTYVNDARPVPPICERTVSEGRLTERCNGNMVKVEPSAVLETIKRKVSKS